MRECSKTPGGVDKGCSVKLLGKSKAKENYQSLGDQARDRGDWVAAVENYTRHLAEAPEDAGIWVQLGHAYKGTGNLDDAARSYFRSLSLLPDVADTHVQIGHVEKLKGRIDSAYSWYRRALDLDPGCDAAAAEFASLAEEEAERNAAGAAAQASVDEAAQTGFSETIDRVDARIDQLELHLAEFGDLGNAVRAIGGELLRLRQRGDAIEARLDGLAGEITSLQASLEDRAAGLENRLAHVEEVPGAARGRLTQLLVGYQGVNALEEEIRVLRRQIGGLSGGHGE